MRFPSFRAFLLLGGVVVTLLGPAASSASAQYFGRNKVNYDAFDWEIIRTEHFDIYFYEEERPAALMAGRMAERWYSRLSRILNHEIRARQPLVLYASHPDFEQTNTTPEQVGEATGGFTEILKRRVVLPLQNGLSESDHVLGHELVHAFQFDITGQGPNAAGVDIPGAIRLPLWFIEGMAEYLSIGPIDPNTAMWMRDGIECECLPSISQLNDPRFFPYRYGQALWSYVAGTYGDEIVGRILKVAGRTGSAIGAFQAVLGMTIDSLSANWHETTREAYEPILAQTDPPETYGKLIIGGEPGRFGGRQNVSPSLSPDGQQILYLSEAGLFSIDLFLADANTGETLKKVTKTALDPHFEALQFILSSGSWHPDGDRFALAGINKGRPVISIIDVERKKRVDEYRFDELDEITNPSWADDGRIAFSAMQGGFSDLWLYDPATKQTTRLTDDPFTDLEPEFSPDGTKLVFVTDRFDTDLGRLDFGRNQLALYDLTTGEIERLPNLEGKNINPSFTPDGQYVLFLSDETGIPNIYRLELQTGRIDQLTNVQTGIAGITGASPALTVASRTGEIAFSLYWHGPFRWNIYTAESHEALARAYAEATQAREQELAAQDREAGVYAAILPPEERATDLLALIENPQIGLADALTFDFGDYNPKLGLDFVSQPSLAVGADQFGFFVGAGAQLFFSDMLGNRNLAAALQVNTGAGSIDRSTSLVLAYENRRGRWNVGGQISQVPLISEAVGFGIGEIDGVPVQVYTTDRFYQINRLLLGGVTYPLNRSQRLEFGGGLQAIDFARTLNTQIFTLAGQRIFDETTDLDAPSSLYLGRASVALVYDNSIFGGNGPVVGQRYRLEVSPAIGSIAIYNFTFDYRKYFMPVFPFTIAFRGLTSGRYGADADDPRLSQIYVGWPALVRGYESNSFTVNECTIPEFDPDQINRCQEIEDLLGSKVAVFNLEPRLPLLGPLGVLGRGAFPPLDLITFFDVGVAWTNDVKPSIFGCDTCVREPISSVGFGMRLNLFGLIILEGDLVNPLQRPDKSWFFQFVANGGF